MPTFRVWGTVSVPGKWQKLFYAAIILGTMFIIANAFMPKIKSQPKPKTLIIYPPDRGSNHSGRWM